MLAWRWRVVTIHLERPPDNRIGPTDVVLGYRDSRRIQKLAAASKGRLRVVDVSSAYFRLQPDEMEPLALYQVLKALLDSGEEE